jgi:hypothetical protein
LAYSFPFHTLRGKDILVSNFTIRHFFFGRHRALALKRGALCICRRGIFSCVQRDVRSLDENQCDIYNISICSNYDFSISPPRYSPFEELIAHNQCKSRHTPPYYRGRYQAFKAFRRSGIHPVPYPPGCNSTRQVFSERSFDVNAKPRISTREGWTGVRRFSASKINKLPALHRNTGVAV